MTTGAQSDGIREACTDQVNRALVRSSLLGIPASALLAWILGSSVPVPRRLAFVAFVGIADVITFAAARSYLGRRKRGESTERWWRGPLCTGLVGLAWASPAVMALPGADRVDLRVVYLLFVCGTSATYVVGAAARRSYYYASQVPMLGVVTIAFALSSERETRLLSLAVPIYFLVMTALHHEVHQVVVSELGLRERNESATAALRRANDQLSRRALRDELTRVANRAQFVDQLQQAVAAARHDGSSIGVLYLDLDRFKIVNDSLGHGGGDKLLVAVAGRLQAVLRSDDLIARLGGDEFTILLSRLAERDQAVVVAHRIANALTSPFDIEGRQLNVTASIGVATNLYASDDAETLLSHADAAQYRAKQAGRDRIEVFDIALRESIQRRLDDVGELRTAIADGSMITWYQPEIDMQTGRIVGAEALARWKHPHRGVLTAGTFVPLAEQAGLTYALDNRAVTLAVGARAELARLQVVRDDFRIWCNVSNDQLTRAQPAERLANLLKRAGCSPDHLGIEITETAVLADMDAVAQQIAEARKLGIKIALDDFGTGQSSLTLLRSLAIDRVKIDRSFISDLTAEPRDAAIVRHLIALVHDLHIEVVAEGVETQDQARILTELGCRFAQGFLWDGALPLGELKSRLRAQQADPTESVAPASMHLVGEGHPS